MRKRTGGSPDLDTRAFSRRTLRFTAKANRSGCIVGDWQVGQSTARRAVGGRSVERAERARQRPPSARGPWDRAEGRRRRKRADARPRPPETTGGAVAVRAAGSPAAQPEGRAARAARCGAVAEAEAVPEPALRERSGLRTELRASQALYSNRGGLA